MTAYSPSSSSSDTSSSGGDVVDTTPLSPMTSTTPNEVVAFCLRIARRNAADRRLRQRQDVLDLMPGSGSLSRQFRQLRRQLSRSFRWYRKTTLVSIAAMSSASILAANLQARGPFQTAYRNFSRYEHKMLARLNIACVQAHARSDRFGSSLPVRLGLEAEMFALFAPFHAVGATFADNDVRVLCVHESRSLVSPDPGLRFYLQSTSLRTDGWYSVSNIPAWLFNLLTVHEDLFAGRADKVAWRSAIGTRISTWGHYALNAPCAPLPSPIILESALELWSGHPDDPYHDIATAIAAAEMLV